MNVKDVLDIVTIIIFAAPIVIQGVKWIGHKTHNQKLINLSERANIIVASLDQSHAMSNAQKKDVALNKLSDYASEVGIKVTPTQLHDYIEASVNFIRSLERRI